MPKRISPMLYILVKEPPSNTDYIFELKWDGYRIISRFENGKVRMHSRSGLDYTKRYHLIANDLDTLGHNLIIDGEVVVFNEDGKPDFDALQLYNGHREAIQYCVFDLLWLDGHDLTSLPLIKRKKLLKTLITKSKTLKFSESYTDGQLLYKKTLGGVANVFRKVKTDARLYLVLRLLVVLFRLKSRKISLNNIIIYPS